MRVGGTTYRDTTRTILQMLAIIGTHAGITSTELMDELGVSRAKVKRLSGNSVCDLAAMRRQTPQFMPALNRALGRRLPAARI